MPTTTPDPTPLRSTCHCGAISITAPRLPEYINQCQCTICRRYGAAWGYYHPDEVKIETLGEKEKVIRKYVWGDRDLEFCFCGGCGCVCYWWPLHPPEKGKESEYQMGLNMNNVNPELLRFVDRKLEFSMLRTPVRDGGKRHEDDKAGY
ncbi:glutathione-dependent formaldehyde-activating enzyme protein [Rutstroemia sp. NJR-2017a BBW]|nr:glutathione-dependent formaldehyde-activating enzyme protein [Rutstroemia sp. NJR-2017a BBW]